MASRIGVLTTGSRVRLGLASDEWLVACVRRGDTAAFEALYDRHVGELLRFCVYMLSSRQDAEDAVQATFASAYRALRADSRPVALRPWLFTIARNECLSTLRRRRPVVELDGEAAPGADLVEQIELRDEVRRVFEGLRDLPESQRAALVLAELHGLSHSEVGDVMGVRADQVKAFVYQARSKLVSERAARDADCREIREELATARGPALLRGRLRRHVRSCPDCRTYADGMVRNRRQLGALLPIVPPLALKYRAIEEAIGIGSSDPATLAGGATVGATAAATELAGGGINALVCKVAVGVACLGASAGVGVSVLSSPGGGNGGVANTASGGTSNAALVASVSSGRPLAWTSTTPAYEHAPAGTGSEGSASGEGGSVVVPGVPIVQNGVQVHEVGSPAPGSNGTSSPSDKGGRTGGGGPATAPGKGPGHGDASGARHSQREAARHASEERVAAREERKLERHTPPSEEERRLRREQKSNEKRESESEGNSGAPPTEEEIQAKKERRARRQAEHRKRLEEQEAREAEAREAEAGG